MLLYLILLFFLASLILVLCVIHLRKPRLLQHQVKASLQKIRKLLAIKNWKEASLELSKLSSSRYFKEEVSLYKAKYFRMTKQYLNAYKELLPIYHQQINTSEIVLEFGKILYELGNKEEAFQLFSRYQDQLSCPEDHCFYARMLMVFSPEEGWQVVKPLIQESPNQEFYELAGDYYYYRERFGQALRFYRKSKLLDNVHVEMRIGQCLKRIGFLQEALDVLIPLFERYPNNVLLALELGTVFEMQSRYKEALAIYQKPSIWSLGDYRILRQSGYCALEMQHDLYAQSYLEEALSKGSCCLKTFKWLGLSLENQKMWSEAESIYKKLIKMYPDHFYGYKALSRMYGIGVSTSLTKEEALSMAQELVKLFPEVSSLEILSACEARHGNFAAATQIQHQISNQSESSDQKQRCLEAIEALEQGVPLDNLFIGNSLVA